MEDEGKIQPGRSVSPSGRDPDALSRRRLSWGLAVTGNLLFFLLFGMVARVVIKPGSPNPDDTIPVIVVAAEDIFPKPEITEDDFVPVEPEDQEPATPAAVTSSEAEESEDLPEPPEPEIVETEEEADQPVPPKPSLPPQRAAPLPEVDLPEAQSGGPAGVIALQCYEIFSDPDKAAECAGRTEIRSGWTAEGTDWSGIVSSLRQGGIDAKEGQPLYGPAQASLPRGNDFTSNFGERGYLGPKVADDLHDIERFQAMKDPRSTISEMQSPVDNQFSNLGDGGTVPLFLERWEPSWVLKDDPYVDQKLIDEMIRESERHREPKKD